MALTLTIAPLNGKIGVKKTQKFTATPSGAAAGAVVSYEWFVDGTVQADKTSSEFDYVASTLGAKTIKVVASAHVEGEDPVETAEATTTLTVEKNVMPALTATASTTTPTIKLGENYTVKCDVTGQPAGSTLTYLWSTGETTQSVTKASTAVGALKLTCAVTAKHADYNDGTKTSNEITVTVGKKVQDTAAVASPATQTIEQDTEYTVTASVTNQPSGAVLTYLWSTGETTATVKKKATASGVIELTCTVTSKVTDYDDKVITTNKAVINVTKIKVPGFVAVLLAEPPSVKVGDTYTVNAIVGATPPGATFEYRWDTSATTESIEAVAKFVGETSHSCTITCKHPDYEDSVLTKEVVVIVEEAFDPEVDAVYVHPLPHRNSAYIWAGWWVMDEIERLTREGKDWKNPPEDSKYKLHLKVLAKMITDYPEVDVQESRNGRIVHRTALELGIIY